MNAKGDCKRSQQNLSLGYKPIFHQYTKYLASGAGVGHCPRRQNFVLGIPTCWYLKCENVCHPTPNPRRQTPNTKPPTPNLEFALAPPPNPAASQWNIGCIGSQPKMLALAMYISCFLCRFHLRWVPNANPISSGIWTIEYCLSMLLINVYNCLL